MASVPYSAKRDASTSSSLSADPTVKHHAATKTSATKDPASPRQLLLGLFFGVVFGFLLQRGGVAKYHILMGALFLEDFTVMKVMLSAIVVGMVGVLSLHGLGLVKLHLKPTRYAANVVGGLIFGVGFALLGYCPGTGSAALGQGNFDALAGIAGLMAGSYLFAELSARLDRTLMKWGDRGNVTFPDLLRVRTRSFVLVCVPVLVLVLVLLDRLPMDR